MDRYGYPGRVSYLAPVNRYKPNYRGSRGLGRVRPVKSGGYVGAPGKRVRGMRRYTNAQSDFNMMAGLGIILTGPGLSGQTEMAIRGQGVGSVSDREMCRILSSVGTAVGSAVGEASLGSRPSQRSGESDRAYRQRLSDWQTAKRALEATSGSLEAAQNLCNLIDEAEEQSEVGGALPDSGPSAWEVARAREQLAQMQQRAAGGSDTTKILLGVAGVAAAAGAVWYLLR